MNDTQKDVAVSYMLSPKRGPSNDAIFLAYFLYSELPQNSSLQSLWVQWAYSGDLVVDGVQDIFYRLISNARINIYKFE